MKKLTLKRLKELLYYDPDTGIFTRKITTNYNAKEGDTAGSPAGGYFQTYINGKIYGNHRLAWLYVHGYFPENDIDHINGIRNDNRICNLREIHRQCNLRNCGNSITNTSGVKGVSWNNNENKWEAKITVNYKQRGLGCYKSFNDAVCARLAGEQCLNWSGCDSNSPAYQYVQEMLKKPKKRKFPKIIV